MFIETIKRRPQYLVPPLLALFIFLIGSTFLVDAEPVQQEAHYVGGKVCATCHLSVVESYEKVGMAKTLQPIEEALPIEDWKKNNRYYHEQSDQHFLMTKRDGKFFQKRYQLDVDGRQTNTFEMEIGYAIGSGFKERDYAAQLPSGELVQFPVVWYRDEGRWSIAPGYDHPNHDGFRRRLNYRCISCHAAYPELEDDQGRYEIQTPLFKQGVLTAIDCERCHGPASNHVQKASSGLSALEIRDSIVNPSRLPRDRELDVCLQCHLETTSIELPNSTLKIGRGIFSFRPGERLTDYAVYFDFPEGTGHDDDFNIVHQGYRLARSTCFKNSEMTCLTCHNPHRTVVDPRKFFKERCLGCHTLESCSLDISDREINGDNCVTCHMPQRRTDDIVHVVMTDHYIQRFAPTDPLAPIAERDNQGYQGEIRFYLPEENESVYMGIGLARGPNVQRGAQMLEDIIKDFSQAAEPYFFLAAAHSELGNSDLGIDHYNRVIEIDPNFAEAHYNLGLLHLKEEQLERALECFNEAIRLQPSRADNHVVKGVALARLGYLDEAKKAYLEAVKFDPLNTVALNNLGVLDLLEGNRGSGRSYFIRVLQIEPNDQAAKEMLDQIGR